MFKPWWDMAKLAAETQQAVWLRCMTFGVGGSTEPVEAASSLAVAETLATRKRATPVKVARPVTRSVKRGRKPVKARKRRKAK